jgi:hypothetical protein
MSLKRDAMRAIHDDPVRKLREKAEEERSKGPRVKAFLRHREEDHTLSQKHREESLKLNSKHRLARAAEYQIDRPRPLRFEENMDAENSALNERHAKERGALGQRHEKEMSEIKD